MVCDRCIEAVANELKLLNIPYKHVQLGSAVLEHSLTNKNKLAIKEALFKRGFELLENPTDRLIDTMKNLILEVVRGKQIKTNLSTYLEEQLDKEYSQLSTLFSSVNGITIERFVILQKIERVKELLTYNELNLSEIAYSCDYSSVQHLSNQFKKNTGMTPSEFKKIHSNDRKPLDKI